MSEPKFKKGDLLRVRDIPLNKGLTLFQIGDVYPLLSYGRANNWNDPELYVQLDVENGTLDRKMMHYEARFELVQASIKPDAEITGEKFQAWIDKLSYALDELGGPEVQHKLRGPEAARLTLLEVLIEMRKV